MTQSEFKKKLNYLSLSYQEHGKWLIINDNNGNVLLQNQSIDYLPEYIIFNNKGKVNLASNNLKSFSNNIIFTKNVNIIITSGFDEFKLEYYSNYFSKLNELYITELIYNLRFEKLISIYCPLVYISRIYQTPHICLTKVLKDNQNEKVIKIKLPKSFLSISSWI